MQRSTLLSILELANDVLDGRPSDDSQGEQKGDYADECTSGITVGKHWRPRGDSALYCVAAFVFASNPMQTVYVQQWEVRVYTWTNVREDDLICFFYYKDCLYRSRCSFV